MGRIRASAFAPALLVLLAGLASVGCQDDSGAAGAGPSKPFRTAGRCTGFVGVVAGPFVARGAAVDCVPADSLMPGDRCTSRFEREAEKALCSFYYDDTCKQRDRCDELTACAALTFFGDAPDVGCVAGNRGMCNEGQVECICRFTLDETEELFCGCDCDF